MKSIESMSWKFPKSIFFMFKKFHEIDLIFYKNQVLLMIELHTFNKNGGWRRIEIWAMNCFERWRVFFLEKVTLLIRSFLNRMTSNKIRKSYFRRWFLSRIFLSNIDFDVNSAVFFHHIFPIKNDMLLHYFGVRSPIFSASSTIFKFWSKWHQIIVWFGLFSYLPGPLKMSQI